MSPFYVTILLSPVVDKKIKDFPITHWPSDQYLNRENVTVKNMIKLAMIVKCLKSVLEGTIRSGLKYQFHLRMWHPDWIPKNFSFRP